jgi:hypothetical protein
MAADRRDEPLVTPEARRRGNVRLAWTLAAFVAVVFVGFLVKSAIHGI